MQCLLLHPFSARNCIKDTPPVPQCVNGVVNGDSCDCSGTQYTGHLCNSPIHSCTPNPCENGGICKCVGEECLTYTCECPDGFEGATCGVDTNDCSINLCQHGGTCLDGIYSYACQCPPGYHGSKCEVSKAEISSLLAMSKRVLFLFFFCHRILIAARLIAW